MTKEQSTMRTVYYRIAMGTGGRHLRSVLSAVRHGAVYASGTPNGPWWYLTRICPWPKRPTVRGFGVFLCYGRQGHTHGYANLASCRRQTERVLRRARPVYSDYNPTAPLHVGKLGIGKMERRERCEETTRSRGESNSVTYFLRTVSPMRSTMRMIGKGAAAIRRREGAEQSTWSLRPGVCTASNRWV